MQNRKILIIVVSLIFATVLSAFIILKPQAQNRNQQQQIDKKLRKTKDQELDDEATPKVQYKDLKDKHTENNARAKKNKRLNNFRWVQPPEIADRLGEVIMHIEIEIPDVPVKESNIILQGTVIDSQAFLSEDNSGVYSEFSINIEGVFKNNTNLNINDLIVGQRGGGVIIYPSGKAVRYKIAGDGSPSRNSKYIFFLKKLDEDIYSILTAYEIQGDKVMPLDGGRLSFSGFGGSVFDKHANESLQSFIEQLQEKIRNPLK